MYIVYTLRSLQDGNLYVGCTSNLEKRLEAHQKGRVTSTRHRLPMELLYKEEYQDKYEAFKVERFYKTATGKRVLKSKIP